MNIAKSKIKPSVKNGGKGGGGGGGGGLKENNRKQNIEV